MNTVINDKLDALISLTAKDCGNDDVEMFKKLDTSGVSLDKRFYIKLKHIIRKHKCSSSTLTIKKFFVRAAVALMALMSLGFLTIMAMPDLREAVFDAVVEWYDNYISIRYEPVTYDTQGADTTTQSPDSSFKADSEDEGTVSVVTPPARIEKVMKPTYIPKDFEEEVLISDISCFVIEYYKVNDLYYTYYQTIIDEHDKWFDNNNARITEITLNNETIATLIEYNDRENKYIIWNDGQYVYHIEVFKSSLSLEELIKIAESVQ